MLITLISLSTSFLVFFFHQFGLIINSSDNFASLCAWIASLNHNSYLSVELHPLVCIAHLVLAIDLDLVLILFLFSMLRIVRSGSSLLNLQCKFQRFSTALLQVDIDSYNGVTVKEDLTSLSQDDFKTRLAHSVAQWKTDSRKGVWLRVPISASNLIPIAVEQDFWFHHAGADYLVLCTWLQGGQSESRLPSRPSHYNGVSGFVLNSKQELLVIQEKNGPAAKMDLWKLPGGLCDQNENLSAGAVREVKEETGECESDMHLTLP